MSHAIRALAALSFALLLAGCGQSGPLYLPGDPSQVQTPPPQSTSDEADDETEDDGRE